MVLEAYSGKVLLASNATEKRPIASLTKIATAAVALDWVSAAGRDIAQVDMVVPQMVTLVGGPNPMNLRPGDHLKLRDGLYAMLLGSDNLAAVTIADHVGRQLLINRAKRGEPVEEFVAEMNRLATALGMDRTRFGNPHGLERPKLKAHSTAVDVARLSVYAMRLNAFSFIVRQKSRQITVFGVDGNRVYTVHNTNELVGESGVLGIKTGLTSAAGPCVAICSHKDPLVRQKPDGSKGVTPRRLIVVVLNSPDRFGRAREMVRRGWLEYNAWIDRGAPVENPKKEIIAVPEPA